MGYSPFAMDQCRYDGSRLLLRGPKRDLDNPFVACLGGTDTFARFIEMPYPDLLEKALGLTCVNFGWPNAGIDVFRGDAALLDCASRARLCVLQVPNALNMSNMYYRVHPRRNDRVLEVTDAMRALFPDTDFTEFHFTRHMLLRLRKAWPDQYRYLYKELCSVWVTGMEDLLGRIQTPVILLWLSLRKPEEAITRPDLAADPGLVSRDMLKAIAPRASAMVEVSVLPSVRGINAGDVPGGRLHRLNAEATMSAEAHQRVAVELHPVLKRRLYNKKDPPGSAGP